MGDDRRLVVAVAPLERVDRRRAAPRAPRARAGSWSTASASARTSAGDVVELRLEPGQPLGERLEARVEAGERPRLAERRPRPLRGRPLPSPASASWTAAAPRAIASPCWAAASRARISSASPGRRRARGDLGRLVLEQLEPAGELARVDRELGQGRPVRAPALDGVGHRGARGRRAAERVEQVALPALVEQPLLVVLAVDLDERPDLVGEPRAVVAWSSSRARGSSAGGHLADGDERLREPVEQRLHPRRLRAVADERRVRPRARARPSASMSRLLPAPVSPVRTLRPGLERSGGAGR